MTGPRRAGGCTVPACGRPAVGVTTVFVRGRVLARRVCLVHEGELVALVDRTREAGYLAGKSGTVRTVRAA